MNRVLVLGLGNLLYGDEGIGVHAVRAWLERVEVPEGVVALDGGTLGLDLLPDLVDMTHLLIIDAIVTTAPPGTIARITGDQLAGSVGGGLSPHELGVQELLATAALAGCLPPHVLVLGVSPAVTGLGAELSPALSAAIPAICAARRKSTCSAGLLTARS